MRFYERAHFIASYSKQLQKSIINKWRVNVGSLAAVSYFFITTLFSLIIFILWGRMFIRYFSISRLSPLSQSIYQLTNPLVTPIQQYIFHDIGSRSTYDWACLSLLALCELVKFTLLNFIFLNNALPFYNIIFFTITDLVIQPCNILFYMIIIRVVISWVNPDWRNPLASVLISITEPLLLAIRRVLPNSGVFDFSPVVAIMALKIIEILLLSLLPVPML